MNAPPRIAEYRGTGPLGGWIRISVVRAALRARERAQRTEPVALDDDTAAAPGLAPETAHLRKLYGPAVDVALREALDALEQRSRELLRLHHVEARSIDDLATQFAVHRATAARWIVAARVAVFEDTKRRVAAKLNIPDAELDSVMHQIVSQLDISLHRLG